MLYDSASHPPDFFEKKKLAAFELLKKLVDEFFQVIKTTLRSQKNIQLSGFGSFEILETKDINTAAIAGEHFKNDERFKILKENISNHQENFTRFLLIGNEKLESNKENNKYSSVLISDDKPGSLLKALNIFSDLNINLTKLESRPILGRPWEYKFYIDYELQNVKKQMELIDGIKKVSKEFIILGHYPKANP